MVMLPSETWLLARSIVLESLRFLEHARAVQESLSLGSITHPKPSCGYLPQDGSRILARKNPMLLSPSSYLFVTLEMLLEKRNSPEANYEKTCSLHPPVATRHAQLHSQEMGRS
jgi:hypothetical protein